MAPAINAVSNNRLVVVLADLSGFESSPESMRRLQLCRKGGTSGTECDPCTWVTNSASPELGPVQFGRSLVDSSPQVRLTSPRHVRTFDALESDFSSVWVVREDGTETKLYFRQFSERSSQIANYLRSLGVKRVDSLLLTLGNVSIVGVDPCRHEAWRRCHTADAAHSTCSLRIATAANRDDTTVTISC